MLEFTPDYIASDQAKARAFFAAQHDVCLKLSRKEDPNLQHSYVFNSESEHLYAFSRDKIAAISGNSLSVKEVIGGPDNVKSAVKVVVLNKAEDIQSMPEIIALEKLGRLNDAILRKLPKDKEFENNGKIYLINHKLYIIQKLIHGNNLDYCLNEYERGAEEATQFNPPTALHVAIQLTLKLAELHDLGIIHGDLKPKNIMIYSENHELKAELVDFGNACILKPGQTKGFLPYLGGTAQYRAPESKERQKQGHFYSFETDVYSLMKIFKDDLGLKLDELGERPPVKDLLSVLLTKLHIEACENPDNPNTKQYHQYYFNTKTLEQAASYHHLTKEQIITLNFLKDPSEASLKDVINIFNHPEKSSSFKLKTFFKKSKLSHSDYNKLEDIFKFKELEKTKDLSGFILSISKQQKFSIVNQFVQTTIALTAIAHQAPTAPQAQVKMKL